VSVVRLACAVLWEVPVDVLQTWHRATTTAPSTPSAACCSWPSACIRCPISQETFCNTYTFSVQTRVPIMDTLGSTGHGVCHADLLAVVKLAASMTSKSGMVSGESNVSYHWQRCSCPESDGPAIMVQAGSGLYQSAEFCFLVTNSGEVAHEFTVGLAKQTVCSTRLRSQQSVCLLAVAQALLSCSLLATVCQRSTVHSIQIFL